MDQVINVSGRQYIVPTGKLNALVGWLEANAVKADQKEVVREVTGDVADSRQLLTEQG